MKIILRDLFHLKKIMNKFIIASKLDSNKKYNGILESLTHTRVESKDSKLGLNKGFHGFSIRKYYSKIH